MVENDDDEFGIHDFPQAPRETHEDENQRIQASEQDDDEVNKQKKNIPQ